MGLAVGFVLVLFTVIMGFCGLVAALGQPRMAYRAVGHHKMVWILVELAGLIPFISILTLPLFLNWPLRQIRRAGVYKKPNAPGRGHQTGWCVTCGGVNSVGCATCHGAGKY